MKKIRLLSLVLGVVLIAGGAVGCGNTESSKKEGQITSSLVKHCLASFREELT